MTIVFVWFVEISCLHDGRIHKETGRKVALYFIDTTASYCHELKVQWKWLNVLFAPFLLGYCTSKTVARWNCSLQKCWWVRWSHWIGFVRVVVTMPPPSVHSFKQTHDSNSVNPTCLVFEWPFFYFFFIFWNSPFVLKRQSHHLAIFSTDSCISFMSTMCTKIKRVFSHSQHLFLLFLYFCA